MQNTNHIQQDENGKGCKVKKTYPKSQIKKNYDNIVNLDRLNDAIREEGRIGI